MVSLNVGQTLPIAVQFFKSSGAGAPLPGQVLIESDNPSVATVSYNQAAGYGSVVGVAPGNAKISAQCGVWNGSLDVSINGYLAVIPGTPHS